VTYETGDSKTAGSKKSLEEEGALHAGLMKQAFLNCRSRAASSIGECG